MEGRSELILALRKELIVPHQESTWDEIEVQDVILVDDTEAGAEVETIADMVGIEVEAGIDTIDESVDREVLSTDLPGDQSVRIERTIGTDKTRDV